VSLYRIRGWRYILFFLLAAATLYFLYRVREVLYAFGISGVLAYFLYRPVNELEKRGMKRAMAILLIYGLLALSLAALVYWLVPITAAEIGDLAKIYPQCVSDIQRIAAQMDGIPKPERLQVFIENNLRQIETGIYNSLQNFINTWYHLLNRILAIVFAPLLAFHILVDWEKIRDGFLNLLPPRGRTQLLILCQEIDRIMAEFIKGYFLVAIMVGLLTGGLAALLGVPFPTIIGIVAAVTNLVPYFGPLLGGIPAVLLAWSVSFKLAVYMALGMVIIQQLDAHLFTPRVIGQKLGMHPLLIIFVVLAGGTLFGLWGIILALPAAAVLKVLLHWAYLKIAE
jgi:predicted PurR-regulated permease PerM